MPAPIPATVAVGGPAAQVKELLPSVQAELAKQPAADPVIAGYLVEGGWHGTSQKLAKTAEAIAA